VHLTPKYTWKLKLAIALFLLGQSFSIAHAFEHGSDSHHHDGVACIHWAFGTYRLCHRLNRSPDSQYTRYRFVERT